jgi:hypothetical protein
MEKTRRKPPAANSESGHAPPWHGTEIDPFWIDDEEMAEAEEETVMGESPEEPGYGYGV